MKNTRYLRTAVGLALVGAVTLSAGCAAGAGSTDTKGDLGGTVTILWEAGAKDALDKVIAEYKKENPEATVEAEYLEASAIKTQIPTQLSAGTAPDLFRTEAGSGTTTATQVLASRGLLAPIEIEELDLPESITATMTYEGELYGFTPVMQAVGQVFNTEALAASGLAVPQTWDEVLPFCADARKAGTVAYAQGPVSLHENQTTPYALSGELVYAAIPDVDEQMKDGSLTFADSPWREVFERTLEMVDAGCFPDGFEGNDMNSVIESLATGNALGMVGYTGYLPYAAASGAEFEIYPLPASDDPENSRLLVSPAQPFGLNAKAKNPALAQDFLRFVAQPDISELYATTLNPVGGLLPTSYRQSAPPSNQLTDTMLEFLENDRSFQFPDATWPNPEVQLAMQSGMQEAIQGKRSVDDVLAAMQQAYDLGGVE